MKILLVHKYFYYNGGADVFFFEVARVLKDNGHEVAYFSTKSEKAIESKWCKYFVDAPNFKGGIIDKIKAFKNIPYNKKIEKAFNQLLDDFNPDIIHCFNIMTQISPSILFAAHKRSIPIVMSLNDYKHICPNYKLFYHGHVCENCKNGNYWHCIVNRCAHNSFVYSMASAYESYIHKKKDVYKKNISLFLFASDFMANKTEEFWKCNIKKGKLLNPFKIPTLNDEEMSDYGLYFGRLVDEKGVDILLKALSENKNLKFKVVGNGPDEEILKLIANRNGLTNVEFVGAKWGADLDEYLNKCRYVVVPSRWYENFPYTILQAFAASKPVIGSNRGGIPEMISSDRGYIYDADNYKMLCALMTKFSDDIDLCKSMGKKGRMYVEKTYNDEVFYNSIVNNYSKILKKEI